VPKHFVSCLVFTAPWPPLAHLPRLHPPLCKRTRGWTNSSQSPCRSYAAGASCWRHNLNGIPQLDEGNVIMVNVLWCRCVAWMRDKPYLLARAHVFLGVILIAVLHLTCACVRVPTTRARLTGCGARRCTSVWGAGEAATHRVRYLAGCPPSVDASIHDFRVAYGCVVYEPGPSRTSEEGRKRRTQTHSPVVLPIEDAVGSGEHPSRVDQLSCAGAGFSSKLADDQGAGGDARKVRATMHTHAPLAAAAPKSSEKCHNSE
jgi:hypothetical protein